jgi:hypothetical protein
MAKHGKKRSAKTNRPKTKLGLGAIRVDLLLSPSEHILWAALSAAPQPTALK